MDFDLDDPLGDLLSDGSNDSFFGSSKKIEPKKSTKSTKLVTSDVKSKFDLFGIDSETNAKPKDNKFEKNPNSNPTQSRPIHSSSEPSKSTLKDEVPPINPQPLTKTTTPATGKTAMEPETKAKKDTQFDDSDDFLNELGFDPKHPKGSAMKNTKKTNILDDILNFSRTDAVTKPTAPSPSPVSKPSTSELDKKVANPAESNQIANRYSPSSGRTRNLPRSSSGGSLLGDPLGIFSKQEPKKDENVTSAKRPKSSSKKPTVDWLGLETDEMDDVKPDTIVPQADEAKIKTEITKPVQSTPAMQTSIPSVTNLTSAPNLPTRIPAVATTNATDLSANLHLMNATAFENEQALHTLQHQETQLRIATQMKQQENMLHNMHSKQQALIKLQENQFNDLLQRQINRQNQLESQIHQQQEQINAYIGVLMNQPSIGLMGATKMLAHDTDTHSEPRQDDADVDTSRQHFIELEADVKRLELEKLRLEDTLQSIQTAHEQELELLHMSHK